MKSRSVNKIILIGNAVNDTKLHELSGGSKVANTIIATSRNWVSSDGKEKEDTQFHRVVAWNKLAEIFDQFVKKGNKVYIEGRIQTRKFTDSEGREKSSTEIIANEMLLLHRSEDKTEEEQKDAETEKENKLSPEVF